MGMRTKTTTTMTLKWSFFGQGVKRVVVVVGVVVVVVVVVVIKKILILVSGLYE